MGCRSGCPTNDHDSWGACARAANFQIDRYALQGSNQPLEKAKNRTLDRYRQMRESGLQPPGILKTDLDNFEKTLSDKKPRKVTNDA